MITTISVACALILLAVAIFAIVERAFKIRDLKKILATQSEQIQSYQIKREEFAMMMSQANKSTDNNVEDPITHLLSKSVFQKQFDFLISQSKRFNNLFAVLMIQFKYENKNPSKESNEKILIELSTRLKSIKRGADIACCYEENTFVILLPNMIKPEIVVHAVERIIQGLASSITVDGNTIEITTYAGITIYPFDGDNIESLIKNAKIALEKAKANGKNVFQFYQQETQTLGERELQLKNAIKNEDFLKYITLDYKPYLNTLKNEIACIDVIAFMNHPELGKISFNEFVRIAQYSSKMFELYEWMMKSAIVKFDLPNITTKPKRFIFHFNIKQFDAPNFIEKITAIIKKQANEDNQIIIEIMDDADNKQSLESLKTSIQKINQSNISIAIGILLLGNIALSKVDSVHFSYLKIDEKLVKDIVNRDESKAILEKIMLLADSLKIETLTTGVDTEDQKNILNDLGCIIMQGKLFDEKKQSEGFFIEKESN